MKSIIVSPSGRRSRNPLGVTTGGHPRCLVQSSPAFITSDAAHAPGPRTCRLLLGEPEDAALAEPNHARDPVAETVLRSERRHYLVLERRIGDSLGSVLIFSGLTLQLQPSRALDVAAPARTAGAEVGLAVHHHDPDGGGPRPAALVRADHLNRLEIPPPAPVLRRRLGVAGAHER